MLWHERTLIALCDAINLVRQAGGGCVRTLGRGLIAILILIIAMVVFGGVSQNWNIQVPTGALSTPQLVAFRDLVLDQQKLASDNAYIAIDGVYTGLNANLGMLYPPAYTLMGMANADSVQIIEDGSSREVRDFFYSCRQAGYNGCKVHLIAHVTTCYLKINNNATFPCLSAERVSSR
jgi:hypothetical protein